jgi:hypothetical protein
MKRHRYKVTLEHLATAADHQTLHQEPLVFEAINHDDIFTIVERVRSGTDLDAHEAASVAVGLKLLSEVALIHRREELFSDLSAALGAFIGKLKAANQAR